MALPYFYEPSIPSRTASFVLSEESSKHCSRVLRMQAGDALHITDGNGHLYTASIVVPDKKGTEVNINNSVYQPLSGRSVCLAISLLKNAGRFEWLLEKAAELGVREIMPLLCDRTEKQHFRHDRMNNILVAAMLQSQQTRLTVLHQPRPFDDILTIERAQRLIAHCEAGGRNEIRKLSLEKEVLMLIGPEGDFSPVEIERSLTAGFAPVTLGETRLRAETAGIVSATLLMNL